MTDPNLGSNRRDALVAGAKGISGAIPFAGGIIAEIIGHIIPNQRADRLASFVAKLDARLAHLEGRFPPERLKEPEFVDLFEDAAVQASRALSDDRRGHIAAVLANSLTDDARAQMYHKRLLQVLSELNDAEVIILQSYELNTSYDEDFLQRHEETLRGPIAYMGAEQSEIDRAAVHDTYKQHMQQLGLLAPTFRRPRRGEAPEFDERTGMMKVAGWQLTELGRLLLRQMDLTPGDAV